MPRFVYTRDQRESDLIGSIMGDPPPATLSCTCIAKLLVVRCLMHVRLLYAANVGKQTLQTRAYYPLLDTRSEKQTTTRFYSFSDKYQRQKRIHDESKWVGN